MKASSVELAWREFREAMGDVSTPELMTSNARVNTEYRPARFRSRGYCRTHRVVKPGVGLDKPRAARSFKPKKGYEPRVYPPRPGEIRLKEFLIGEADRRGTSVRAIEFAITRGKYPGLIKRHVNEWVVFVSGDLRFMSGGTVAECRPLPGEVSFRDWAGAKAIEESRSVQCIYMRFARGAYQGLKVRKVNERLKFVRVS